MSWFNKKRKENKKLTPQQRTDQINKAIQDLRSHQTLFAKKTVHLQKQIGKYNNEARSCMKKKNKKGALMKIRLRKQVEKRIENLENQSFNLETQITALDETLINHSIMAAMKNSNKAMKQAMAGINIDDVDDIQEEINEAIALHDEISEAFSRPLNNDYDDDELLAELDDIMEEENEEILFSNMNMNVNVSNNNNVSINKKVSKTKVCIVLYLHVC